MAVFILSYSFSLVENEAVFDYEIDFVDFALKSDCVLKIRVSFWRRSGSVQNYDPASKIMILQV